MKNRTRTLALGLAVSCATISIGALGISPASAVPTGIGAQSQHSHVKADGPINRFIVANMTGRDLDMTVTAGDGTTIHQVVRAREGWYPEADYSGKDTITVRDSSGVAFTGEFTYDGDWIAGKMTTTPRLRYSWHTGVFGGMDFR